MKTKKIKSIFSMLMLAFMALFFLPSCEESNVYGFGDDDGPVNNPVVDVTLADGWTLTTISVDSLAGKKQFTDKGEGKLIFGLKDKTSRDSSIVWKPIATVEYAQNIVWSRKSKAINFENVSKVANSDSANMKRDIYTFNFDEGCQLALDAKSRIVVITPHGIKVELPYFTFKDIEYLGYSSTKLPPEVINGKNVESESVLLSFLVTRSSEKSYRMYVPIKTIIDGGGGGEDPTFIGMDVDQSSSFTRTYDRQTKYKKYIDAWRWIINLRYTDGSKKQQSYEKTLNAWLEIPERQKVYRDNLDFSMTSQRTSETSSTSKNFTFTCGGRTFTIGSFWETATFSYGGKTISLPYHYFNNVSYNKYSTQKLEGEPVENGITYLKYLVTIDMTGNNTSGEQEKFNVYYEVWKKKSGGDNPNPDPKPEDPTRDIDAWIKSGDVDDNNRSNAIITILNNKGIERDTTVSIQYNISWSLDNPFDVTKADNSVAHSGISEGTTSTSTRTLNAFTVSITKTVKISSFTGFSHKINLNNEKATIKVAGKVLNMPSSDLVPVYKTYTQDSPSSVGDLQSYPTHLKYDCSYNNKSTSKTQDGTIRVKKETPTPDPVYDINAWLKDGDVDDNGFVNATYTILNNKGAERDTTVTLQYNNSWSLDNPFDVTKADNTVVHNGISQGSQSTSSRMLNAFTVTKTATTHTASFNGFSHKVYTNVEKATIKIVGKVLPVPSADMTPQFESYTQDSPSTAGNVKSYPTHLRYSCTYKNGKTYKVQDGTIRVTSTPTPDPDYDVDAWFKSQNLTNAGLSSAVITIRNNKGAERDTSVQIQYNIGWAVQNIFDIDKSDNAVVHNGISDITSNTTNRTVGGFSVTTTSARKKSSFTGFSHEITTTNETATITIAGKPLTMLSENVTPVYNNYTQESGSVNGNTTTYPTHLNYSCTYHQGNLGDKTQDVNIKVTKRIPDIIIPDELGKITGADKTIVLKNADASQRINCLSVKTTKGVYANIAGAWYTWVGANTSGVASASMGNSGKWNPAVIIPLKGWNKDQLTEGWVYVTTNGTDSQMSAANCTLYKVTDPRLTCTAVDNNDGTWTIDGKIYGYSK